MRWHSRARSSSASYAFTLAAFDGSGTGSVVIQWFNRKTGAPYGPRFAAQLASRRSALMSRATFVNA
jgi:hypothetical protein